MKHLLILIALPLLGSPMPAAADDGYDLLAGVSMANMDYDCPSSEIASVHVDCDEDAAFKVMFGIENEIGDFVIGAEAGYRTIDGDQDVTISAGGTTVTVSRDYDGKSFGIAVRPGIRLLSSRAEVYALLGFHRWDLDTGPVISDLEGNGTAMFYGVGVEYEVYQGEEGSDVALRLEWERLDIDGDDFDFFGAAVVYEYDLNRLVDR